MDAHGAEEIRKSVKTYYMIFGALMVLTVLTVAVSYLHLPVALAILVALVVATIKGSLVAMFFMHLLHERKVIYYALVLTRDFLHLPDVRAAGHEPGQDCTLGY